MSLRVNTNIAALDAYRNLNISDGEQSKELERLSSGYRINRAADDAAGLAISEGLRSQVSGLTFAVRNAQDGISLVQTAEGALNETTALAQRIRDLGVQAANGTESSAARQASADEVTQALAEIDRIAGATRFGGKTLLDGSQQATYDSTGAYVSGGITFQVGADATAATNQVNVSIADLRSAGLGIAGDSTATAVTLDFGTVSDFTAVAASTLSFTDGNDEVKLSLGGDYTDGATFQKAVQTQLDGVAKGRWTAAVDSSGVVSISSTAKGSSVVMTAASDSTFNGSAVAARTGGTGASSVATMIAYGNTSAITAMDSAISTVNSVRGSLGAYQNRLEHTINNLNVTTENLSASESRIRDADMAQEMVAYTRAQILSQAGTSMLAQANQSSSNVLTLLRG